MKSKFFLLLIALFTFVFMTSCEGPEGPQGPAGIDGVDGVDGMDANANCIDCHGSSQLITAKLSQWENSIHATGGHWARNSSSCATCHTSQGFRERIDAGTQTTAATIDDPLPINCYACHKIHETYTAADWELTASDPVTFWFEGETHDIGAGNMCLNCHQARITDPFPTPGVDEVLSISNKRYGPHHGSQGMLYTGSGAYEVDGALAYENSSHYDNLDNGCVNCHLAAAEGWEAGGHVMNAANADGDINTAGCLDCHSDAESLVETVQTEFDGLMAQLHTKLDDLGMFDGSGYLAVPADYPSLQAGAFYNYKYLEEDRSKGVHNWKYAKALLQNSIDALN